MMGSVSQSPVRSLLVPFLAILLALGAPACAASSEDDDEPGTEGDDLTGEVEQAATSTGNLMVNYDMASPCKVFINIPGEGVTNNTSWTTTGTRITWRYNVNSTWALVSDPNRAGKTYPWWGFTKRECIKGEPERLREGRSNVAASGWRSVVVDVPGASIISRSRQLHENATLRDPANFVVGNVPAGWHVDVTGNTRSDGFWVEVYVPNAKRWGYIRASNL